MIADPSGIADLGKKVPAELAAAEVALQDATILLERERWAGAASRAYYAQFHAAKAVLYQRGSAPTTHRGIISEFIKLFVRPGLVPEHYGRMLRRGVSFAELPTKDLAESDVEDASDFLDGMRQLVASNRT